MKPGKFEMQHFGIYYFSNIIDGLLDNSLPYIEHFDALFGQDNIQHYSGKFNKQSAFHDFIFCVVSSVLSEDRRYNYDNFIKRDFFGLREWFKRHSIDIENRNIFLIDYKGNPEDISEMEFQDYLSEIYSSDVFFDLVAKISDEVFYLLFTNRNILRKFNEFISDYVELLNSSDISDEYKNNFTKKGKVRRKNIPMWVQKAVFFRDRGRCVKCDVDLSNYITINNKINYDHIVPLSLYGINDVTNIQLLCEDCNREKLDKDTSTSKMYERWY